MGKIVLWIIFEKNCGLGFYIIYFESFYIVLSFKWMIGVNFLVLIEKCCVLFIRFKVRSWFGIWIFWKVREWSNNLLFILLV